MVATSKVLSLGSLESVHQLARDLTSTYPTIHYLFNNAGSTPQHDLTDDGLEDAFGGMHLAHMALTLGLIPSLERIEKETGLPARVIMTTSDMGASLAIGMLGPGPSFHPSFLLDRSGEGDLRGEVTRGDGTLLASLRAYGRAKLSNMLFAFEANRRFRARHIPIIVHAVHTGSVRTKTSSTDLAAIFQGIPGLPYIVSNLLVPLFWRRPEEGARTLIFAALSNDPRMEIGGQYVDALCRPWLYVDHPKMKALRDANDMYATRLWNVSLQLINASPAQEFVQMAP
jgi:NAD(P)-dependent dehydrogenase (short-subunit alcohol dehydrogenase family)